MAKIRKKPKKSINKNINKKYTILIDPGHGGNDKGTIANDKITFEKDITLKVGALVAQKLTKQKDVQVKRNFRFSSKKSCRLTKSPSSHGEIFNLGLTARRKSGKLNRHSVRRVRVPTRRDVRVV